MKLYTDMYYLTTFNIPKHEGASEWVAEGCNQKSTRICHEMKGISTFASSKTNVDNPSNSSVHIT